MSICFDCTKERICKNKWLNHHDGCKNYEGNKYWCVSSSKWRDFYVKAETKSKAKGAMWAAIRKEEELEYYKTSFYEFVHSDLYVMQIDSFEYNSGKEHGWHNE